MMKLTELIGKDLNAICDSMEILEFKPRTNDLGEVQSLEIKFVPKDLVVSSALNNKNTFRR